MITLEIDLKPSSATADFRQLTRHVNKATREPWEYDTHGSRVRLYFDSPIDRGSLAMVRREFERIVSQCQSAPGYRCAKVTLVHEGRRLPWNVATPAAGVSLPPLDMTKFARHIGQDAHVRLLYRAAEQAVAGQQRSHVLLTGPPGCGKSELLKTFAGFLGGRLTWLLDATTLTKAGLAHVLVAKASAKKLPPILAIEEIEKCPSANLACLLQVMDGRGAIERTTYRGQQKAEAKLLVLATVNDVKKLQKQFAGALWSRFAFRLQCSRPDRETMRRILWLKCKRDDWVDVVVRFLFDELAAKGYPDYNDPRVAVSLLAGGDGLLSGSFLSDWRKVHGL